MDKAREFIRAPKLGQKIIGGEVGRAIDATADRYRGDVAGAVGGVIGGALKGKSGAVAGTAFAKALIGENIVKPAPSGTPAPTK